MPKATSSPIKKVRKRDGEIVQFDASLITRAINGAIVAVEGKENIRLAEKLTSRVVGELESKFGRKVIPGVEDIQDIVEESLIKRGLTKSPRHTFSTGASALKSGNPARRFLRA